MSLSIRELYCNNNDEYSTTTTIAPSGDVARCALSSASVDINRDNPLRCLVNYALFPARTAVSYPHVNKLPACLPDCLLGTLVAEASCPVIHSSVRITATVLYSVSIEYAFHVASTWSRHGHKASHDHDVVFRFDLTRRRLAADSAWSRASTTPGNPVVV